MKDSTRLAALPELPTAARTSPRSFFSRHEARKAARSERVGDVGLALLEHGDARRALGDALHRHALDVGGVPPVAGIGLQDHLDPRLAAHELVGPGADRVLAKALVADLADVRLRHHDPGRGGRRVVEGHEVGPGLFQVEADGERVDDLDLAHASLELVGPRALVAVVAELHVLGGDGIAVVELEAASQLELVGQPVGTLLFHDSARLGAIFWPGSGRTRASCGA
jgi:hypothetical protein